MSNIIRLYTIVLSVQAKEFIRDCQVVTHQTRGDVKPICKSDFTVRPSIQRRSVKIDISS